MSGRASILRDRSGFTLLELLIALVVLAIGLLGIVGMLLTSVKGNAFSAQITQANAIVLDKMEELRNREYKNLYATCGSAGFPVICSGAPEAIDGITPNDSGTGGDKFTGGSADGLWTYLHANPPSTTAIPTGMTLVWGVKRNYPQPRMIWLMACAVWGGTPATNECALATPSSKSIHVVRIESTLGNF